MSNQTLDPLAPAAAASPSFAQRQLHGLMTLGTTPDAAAAAIAARLFAALRRLAQRLGASDDDKPLSAQDMLALARRVQAESPTLAAELRRIAMHRPVSTEKHHD